MIGLGLVDEAPPAPVDADVAGLAAIEEMRERHDGAIPLRHQRHGRPGCRLVHVAMEGAAGRLREPYAIAGIAGRRQELVVLAGGQVTIDLALEIHVRWETATR